MPTCDIVVPASANTQTKKFGSDRCSQVLDRGADHRGDPEHQRRGDDDAPEPVAVRLADVVEDPADRDPRDVWRRSPVQV